MKVKQSGHIGDLIYSLSACKSLYELTNEQIDFYIGFDNVNQTPNHPSGKYTMTTEAFDYVRPLLLAQPYINSVNIHYKNIEVDFDFDDFRNYKFNIGAYDLRKWHGIVYPELDIRLEDKCVYVEKQLEYLKDKIVVNLTQRYRSFNIDYTPLKGHDVVFVGLDNEYTAFKGLYGLDVKRVNVKDALHMAEIINSCRLFIGNQSSAYAIAEQMKANRALEVYNTSPNVISVAGNMHDYMTTEGLKLILDQHGRNK
jgi:hypothetical protein